MAKSSNTPDRSDTTTLRPKHIVVIGPSFGFSVVCLALGLKDNRRGMLSFVDPSFSLLGNGPFQTFGGTAQRDSPEKVRAQFVRFGVENLISHHRMTREEFFHIYSKTQLDAIDLAFIDFPFSSGLAIVRVMSNGPWESLSL